MRYWPLLLLPMLLACGGYAMPRYTVEWADGPVELRAYEPQLVAQVTIQGEREQAVSDGFRVLADYIFGANQPREKIAMTSPVTQQPAPAGTIAMTSPVTQQAAGANQWQVSFMMPPDYTLATLPVPQNPAIVIRELPPQRALAYRYSGVASDAGFAHGQTQLTNIAAARGLRLGPVPTLAYYDPPWTLPPWRRNEVLWPVE